MAMPPPPPPMSHPRLEEGLRGPPPPHEEVPLFMAYMNVVNTITHLLLGAVAFCAFIIANVAIGTTFSKFSAHIYLTVIGYTILMSQAIFSLSPQSGMANNFKYPQKSLIFWLLQVLGSVLAIIGGIMGVSGVNGIFLWPSLNSAHAIVGLITMILTSVSLVGALAHLFIKSIKNSTMLSAIYSCTVTLTLLLAYTAISLKFSEPDDMDTSSSMALAFAIISIVALFIMMISNKLVGGRFLI